MEMVVVGSLERGVGGLGSLVPGQDQLSKSDEGVSFGRRPELADLSDCLLTVALGEVVRLLYTITLKKDEREIESRT